MKTRIILILIIASYFQSIGQTDYDTTFADDGIFVKTDVQFGSGFELAFQDTDKLVSQLYFQDLNTGAFLRELYRLNINGTIDTTFGTDGVFTDDTTVQFNNPKDLLVDGNTIYTLSSLVVPGTNRTDITITKLTENGVLDTNFGNGGYATLPQIPDTDFTDATSFSRDSNGNFIVGGLLQVTSTQERALIVLKFLQDGTLDTNFATDGIYQLSAESGFDLNVKKVSVHTDSSIAVTLEENSTSEVRITPKIIKLTSDGQLDTAYGTDGLYIDNSGNRLITSVNLLEDESIILSGEEVDEGFNTISTFSTKISPMGTLDTAYATNGYSTLYSGSDLIVTYSQIIFADNYHIFIGDVLDFVQSERSIIATRLFTDGTIDTSYGDNGTRIFTSPSTDFEGIAGRSVIFREGDFYVSGEVELGGGIIKPMVTKIVDPTLSVNEVEPDINSTLLFPNPIHATSVLRFESNTSVNAQLSIVNLLGQTVSYRAIQVETGINHISLEQDIHALSNGIYILNILSENAVLETVKFIKQ